MKRSRPINPKNDRMQREIAAAETLVYQGFLMNLVSLLDIYGGMAREWGVDPGTIEPSGDIESDVLAMHRAVYTMSSRIIAVADARPSRPN